MRRGVGIPTVLSGVVGLALLALGGVYLSVACESLPGFLGGTPGDSAPRTGLGVVCVVVGLVALAVGLIVARRRPPGAPPQT
jgi:drug/metabolite transporter (DMT)-like permease